MGSRAIAAEANSELCFRAVRVSHSAHRDSIGFNAEGIVGCALSACAAARSVDNPTNAVRVRAPLAMVFGDQWPLTRCLCAPIWLQRDRIALQDRLVVVLEIAPVRVNTRVQPFDPNLGTPTFTGVLCQPRSRCVLLPFFFLNSLRRLYKHD